MCGIVGGTGKNDYRKFLISGLRDLEYRGYDSAGIAYRIADQTFVYKREGKVDNLDAIVPDFKDALMGIAHTRWATHGVPSLENAHPQISMNGIVTIVHNGVIQNYKRVKESLIKDGYSFKSETDTEVMADLLEQMVLRTNDPLKSIEKLVEMIDGSYGCLIMIKGFDSLYFMKNESPLIVCKDKNGVYFSSDVFPIISYSTSCIDLPDKSYGYSNGPMLHIYSGGEEIHPEPKQRKKDDYILSLGEYPHYMLKEIEEAKIVLSRLKENYTNGSKYLFDEEILDTIRKSDSVVFLSCGSSHYASLLGVKYFNKLGIRAESYIASEWAYSHEIQSSNPLFILISQSGETGDLIECLKFIKEKGYKTLAITNRIGSTIYEKSDYSLLLYASIEVAVAATKSFIAQAALLNMLAGAIKGNDFNIKEYDELLNAIEDIKDRREEISKISEEIAPNKDAFFVGRGLAYLACLECSLKLKEIAYIHSEAYPAGELKHGPIALVSNGIPVIGFLDSKETSSITRTNLVELSARGARCIIVSMRELSNNGDDFIYKNVCPNYTPIVEIVFGQYLSYYTALRLNLPIDKPRNLAKSVTVK